MRLHSLQVYIVTNFAGLVVSAYVGGGQSPAVAVLPMQNDSVLTFQYSLDTYTIATMWSTHPGYVVLQLSLPF